MKRTLKITERQITVANITSFSGKPYIVSFEAKGILPGCRKVATLSVSASYNAVWVRNLYSHNGEAHILPKDWARMLRTSQVVPDRNFPLPITWEVEQDAIHSVLEFCECGAITNDTDVCEQYKRTQTHDTLSY